MAGTTTPVGRDNDRTQEPAQDATKTDGGGAVGKQLSTFLEVGGHFHRHGHMGHVEQRIGGRKQQQQRAHVNHHGLTGLDVGHGEQQHEGGCAEN